MLNSHKFEDDKLMANLNKWSENLAVRWIEKTDNTVPLTVLIRASYKLVAICARKSNLFTKEVLHKLLDVELENIPEGKGVPS